VETATNAIYSALRPFRAEQIVILDTHTDWGYGRGSRAQYNDFEGFNAGNINAAASRWNGFYLGIRNANLVIANAPNGSAISQENIQKYVAEAKFLRALAYFDLVRNWGSVPLRTENNMKEIGLAKSSVEQIYELILSDLTEAERFLSDEPKHIGRPTKLAAKTMLADVFLHLSRYEEARKKALEIIQSGKYSLVPISNREDIQFKIFGPELITSSEEIFYFKYAREAGQGNFMLWILNHPRTGLFNFGGAYAHYGNSSIPFYKEWDNADIRKQLWDPASFGLGPNTIVNGKYTDTKAINTSGAGNDLPIYRYAEVLLIFAEASARAAGNITEDAMEALNKVHRRAYGKNPTVPSEVDFILNDFNVESFLDLVIQERAYEFQFEGKRWYDLKRTGIAEKMVKLNKGRTIAIKHYLWPIPLEELNFNTALDPSTDQNPGY
jgi:starch-binding outer membrane protein, SusD/RagB family